MATGTRTNSVEARKCLTTVLIKLSGEKPFPAITITELCRAAGVSRMTFYRNYQSKEEVLTSYLAELVEEYRVLNAPLLEAGERWYGIGHLTTCFAFFKEHSDLMTCLFTCGFIKQLVDAVSGYMLSNWGDGTQKSEYLLTAFAGALCSAYALWAKGGFKETPRQMADLMCCFYTGLPSEDA